MDAVVMDAKGKSVLEKNLYAVTFGDYVSLFAAALAEKDPCNVGPIASIKSRIRIVLRLCRAIAVSFRARYNGTL